MSLVALWLERYLLVMPSVTRAARARCSACPSSARRCCSRDLFLLSYALFARTFPMISPRLAEITLDRELAHHHAADMYDHEEPPKDWVQEAAVERREHER